MFLFCEAKEYADSILLLMWRDVKLRSMKLRVFGISAFQGSWFEGECRAGFVSALYLDELYCSAFSIMLGSVVSVHSTNDYLTLCARHHLSLGDVAVNKTKC